MGFACSQSIDCTVLTTHYETQVRNFGKALTVRGWVLASTGEDFFRTKLSNMTWDFAP